MLNGDPATVASTVKVASSAMLKNLGITSRSSEVRIIPAPIKLTAAQPTAQGKGAVARSFQSRRSALIPRQATKAVDVNAIDSATAGNIADVTLSPIARSDANSSEALAQDESTNEKPTRSQLL